MSDTGQRSRTVVVLAVFAVVLFITAGTAGTLWFIERGDHKATSEQLDSARAEAADSKAKRQMAEAKGKDVTDRMYAALREAETVRKSKLESDRCADSSRRSAQAAREKDVSAMTGAINDVVAYCK